jgi:CubicO group peptidase (beta-lactamase class C family)
MSDFTKVSMVVGLLGLVGTACGGPPQLPDQIQEGDWSVLAEQIDWLADDAVSSGGALIIGVVAGGERVHTSRAGELVEGGSPTGQTRFRAASVSKVFTALAVLRLHEEGVIDIDAPLEEQLPGFSVRTRFEDAPPITPRHVLTHHSGLPSDHLPGMFADEAPDMSELLEALADEYVSQPPGGWWSYSNIGYGLLGHLVEVRASEPFADYIDRVIFTPCGMDDSGWELSRSVAGTANGERAEERDQLVVPAAGSLVSTVDDLTRFAQALLDDGACPGGNIVREETLEEAWQVWHYSPFDLDAKWGLGFQITHEQPWLNEELAVGHAGDSMLFHARFLLLPEHDVAVVGMTNEAMLGGGLSAAAYRALQLALETVGEPRPAALPGAPVPAGTSPWTEAELDELTGVYSTMVGVLHVDRSGKTLRTRVMGNDVGLVATDDGTFAINPEVLGFVLPMSLPDLELVFEKIGDDVAVGARGADPGPAWLPLGSRFEPALATPAWRDRLGTWMPEPDVATQTSARRIDVIWLHEDDGVFQVSVLMDSPVGAQELTVGLLPVDDSQVLTAGTGRMASETVRIEEDDEGERLMMMGIPFRRAAR